MCGGKGTRLESDHEKPLFPIEGVSMVDRVSRALEGSRVETVYAAVSPNAPATRRHLEKRAIDGRDELSVLETPGEGYVADLLDVLERPAIEPPILTVAADLPLLEAPAVDRVLRAHGGRNASRTVCVPVALKRRLGVSVETTLEPTDHLAPTGVNVVGTTDESMIDVSYDPRLAVNVNRRTDANTAAKHLQRGGDPCA
ncbi:NTP transferase domain-containing protein [Natrarchaeobaculum sulfurireducens]|uniref:Adenosylcobinamide-phosphate guanylyltransferase CobY n=1 Tax=Natrarchaeobaculum sulfurireducens TaxID=2044521 RepID=A0A346PTA5_9EURY|nr:NTP transferase domain-containing protein [Natrarchaeobaculum sulfurireducens]AXR77287.1 GTP:adenosylcobinamide-phosphate guanylyltransferase [Natrarchaeobaculum sulfurireducens]AXR82750.1 Adenosylcobinamide-phosphate guanylyltransferase CobY [Natrarchaeobaculum sulfurireducens]